MADGDHYASYAECRARLQNAGVGTSGNTLYDDTALELALDCSMQMIHLYLDITTKNTTEPYASVLKHIQLDILEQQVIHGRFFKEQNLTDTGILGAVMAGIIFSQTHLLLLDKITRKLAATT